MSSRLLGVVRDALFSALFGLSKLTDAYRVAFQIPNLLRDLFAEGALSSAFVPAFTDALGKEGRQGAYRLANLILTGLLVVTGGLTALGMLFPDTVVLLVSGGFSGDADKAAFTAQMTAIMMPILTLVSLSAVFMGMLNAQSRFVMPAFAPALFNVTSIAFGLVLVVGRFESRRAILLFSVGTLVAGLVQAACQLPALVRLGYRPRLAVTGLLTDPRVRRIVRLMGPAAIGLAAVQVNVLFNTRFASALGNGPVSALGNAFRLFYLPIGLFGVAMGTVTTTRVSEEAARGDRAALLARATDGARAVAMLASASAVGLIVLAEPVVSLLFERGRFTHQDTLAVARILQAYMLGALPYSLVKIFAPSFYAVDKARVPMMASLSAVAANILFNALTYRRLGAPGLALGTTLAALVNFAILRMAFRRHVGRVREERPVRIWGALVLANAGLGVAVGSAWWLASRALALATDGLPRPVVRAASALLLFVVIALGFAIYVIVLRALRYPGAQELASLPRRLVGRFRRRR